jgi:hypothetical protein
MALNIPGITFSDFNNATRYIVSKIEIYFDGINQAPLIVTQDNYLVDYTITEESSAESKNPLGAISANELSFTLTNFNNMFSPTNTSGIYYGKIKVGIPVKVFIKPGREDATSWIPLGVFYVADWNAKMGSSLADVSCYDNIQDLLLSAMPDLDIKLNTTYGEFIEYVLNAYGYNDVNIDTALYTIFLPYGFIADTETANFLQLLAEAGVASIMSSRTGSLSVQRLNKLPSPVETFTDNNQIISLDVTQSIIKNYNGVKLTYVIPQISEDKEVLKIDNFNVPSGTIQHNMLKFSEPVFGISAININDSAGTKIVSYKATNFGINITTELSNNTSATASISITGKNLDTVEQELNDNTSNMLVVSNPYIQDSDYATTYKEMLNKFITTNIPELTLTVRGNPLLEIGDMIQVSSSKYGVEFTGIIKRVIYKYNGALSCTMTLLNAEVVA